MRFVAYGAAVLAGVVVATPAGAQGPLPASTHARATTGSVTIIDLANVRLVAPPGSAEAGALIGLGVGGVPAPATALPVGDTGLVVSVQGGPRGMLAVVIRPSSRDQLAWRERTPALLDTVTGAAVGCIMRGGLVGCPVHRPSAYLLAGNSTPATADAMIDGELQRALVDSAQTGGRAWQILAAVVVAAGLGFSLAWWAMGRTGPPAPSS